MAINSLINNKLRTFLSLLGITIGIFAIISVFTVLDSLERNIRSSISSFGDDVIYVQKWPWIMAKGNYPWWKFVNRPVVKYREAKFLDKKLTKAECVVFSAGIRKDVTLYGNLVKNVKIQFVTYDYPKVQNFEISQGRFFTNFETDKGRNKAVVGAGIAEKLSENGNLLNKNIKIAGHKVKVVGVTRKEGNNMFGSSLDNTILIPLRYAQSIFDTKNESASPLIMIKAKNGVNLIDLKEEIRGYLRAYRHLSPKMDDTFALNQISMISQGFDQVFVMIDLVGIIIGGFSILVGGFGIANIMFVSVKERTKIIGIQKALGAKRNFILLQFLTESVVLSLVGGIIGLLLIFIGTLIANQVIDVMKFHMSFGNIISGILISAVIGIISGFAPARSAAKLNPVEAINSSF